MLGKISSARLGSIAIQDKSGDLTFDQLEKLISTLQAKLSEVGIRPGVAVGVKASKTLHTVVSFFAILRAGGCFIPLAPNNPPHRNEILLKDTGAQFKIDHLPEIWPSSRYLVTNLSNNQELLVDAADQSIPQEVFTDENEPAYVLYTSGSTGRPKGVVVSHRGAAAFVNWAAGLVAISEDDSILNVTKFDFDLSIFDIFVSLAHGARLYIGEDNIIQHPLNLLGLIERQKITILYTVPWVLIQLLRTSKDLRTRANSLRVIMYAGEAFPIDQLRELMAILPNTRIYNLFGPTETNVCCHYSLPENLPVDATEIPIGRSACDACLYVLDPDGREMPHGEVGELHVEGPTVLMGYMIDGTLVSSGSRYATGDMVYMRSDGELIYKGRRDTLMKIQGARIELLEVEKALQSHCAVRECAVIAADGRLVAFVAADYDPSPLELRQHVAEFLPPYMVPRSISYVKKLPRNANGKIDRRALGDSLKTQKGEK